MNLFVLGINHKTATVDLREKVAFSPQQIQQALFALKSEGVVESAVIVSTCNRTEIYCESNQLNTAHLIAWFCRFHQLEPALIETCLYVFQQELAVSHLMRVACGLDSLVLGEPQILGQVKKLTQTLAIKMRFQVSLSVFFTALFLLRNAFEQKQILVVMRFLSLLQLVFWRDKSSSL